VIVYHYVKELKHQGCVVLDAYESNTLLIITLKKNSSPKTRGQGCGGEAIEEIGPSSRHQRRNLK